MTDFCAVPNSDYEVSRFFIGLDKYIPSLLRMDNINTRNNRNSRIIEHENIKIPEKYITTRDCIKQRDETTATHRHERKNNNHTDDFNTTGNMAGNRENGKGKHIVAIPFQTMENEECVTPCPHGERFEDEDFALMKQLMHDTFPRFKFENVIYVGSGFCGDCEYCDGINSEQHFVLCSHE